MPEVNQGSLGQWWGFLVGTASPSMLWARKHHRLGVAITSPFWATGWGQKLRLVLEF